MILKPHKIYAENVDGAAYAQFASAMACDFAVQGALMPDVHKGYSLPIGAVVATKDVIVPAWVGYDIGCGMCALQTGFEPEDVRTHAKEIYEEIYKRIPVGFNHHQKNQFWPEGNETYLSPALREIFDRNGLKQLGTLGSGNHFIEIGVDGENRIWIIIHSGSRNVGHATATHYMKLASGDGRAREGHYGLDVNSVDGINYSLDLDFLLAFALENRSQMIDVVEQIISEKCSASILRGYFINRNHNHAEKKDGFWIHRKGATHAELGMLGVIPGNMRDGSFIVKGKGNPDSLFSSSHGAGRILGRAQAKKELDLELFGMQMEGIQANVSQATLDESPDAYKPIEEVMEAQKDLVEVIARVKPIINIKG